MILMPFQCHCGSVFNNNRELHRHITVAHKNEYWNCRGEWIWDDGSETPCPTICADRFTLWKHFRSLHQDRYLYYCDVAGCKYGNDEQTQIPKHKLQEHAKKPSDTETHKVLKCSVCSKVFGQHSKLTQHTQICGSQGPDLSSVKSVPKTSVRGINSVFTQSRSTQVLLVTVVGSSNAHTAPRITPVFQHVADTLKTCTSQLLK